MTQFGPSIRNHHLPNNVEQIRYVLRHGRGFKLPSSKADRVQYMKINKLDDNKYLTNLVTYGGIFCFLTSLSKKKNINYVIEWSVRF